MYDIVLYYAIVTYKLLYILVIDAWTKQNVALVKVCYVAFCVDPLLEVYTSQTIVNLFYVGN